MKRNMFENTKRDMSENTMKKKKNNDIIISSNSSRMFELRMVQGSVFRKVVEAIKDLVNDANFDWSESGFSMQAMDSCHVSLVALHLRSEGFDHYHCDHNVSMGMNLANMAKIFKCAANDDILSVKADDDPTDSVTFTFMNPTQEKIDSYKMKLMDIDCEHLAISDTKYEATVRMPSADFATICKNLATFGDTVVISVTNEEVRFFTAGYISDGDNIRKPNASIDKPEEAIIIETQKSVKLTFSLRYMNSFAKATPLASQVTISLSSDQAGVFEYKIADMGYLRFYLAPKHEEEEY